MPEVRIMIGGRPFSVGCQEGEEHFLQSAARMLDVEAQALMGQLGTMTEPRMLLMAGLLLADKTAGMEDRLRALQTELAEAQARVAQALQEAEALRAAPPAEIAVEIPVIPEGLENSLADLAAQAEALADRVEAQD